MSLLDSATDMFGASFETVTRAVFPHIIPLATRIDTTDTGYATMWSRRGKWWKPNGHFGLGSVETIEKWMKYEMLVVEKAVRLIQHLDHVSSFQSHDLSDPADPKYPGAVRMDRFEAVMSTSGLTWQYDEIVGMLQGWGRCNSSRGTASGASSSTA